MFKEKKHCYVYKYGERFLYLGNYYNLKLVDNREILLDFKDEFLLSKKYLSYRRFRRCS
jgi:hypothetical protein